MKRLLTLFTTLSLLPFLTACPQKRPGDDSPNMGKVLFTTNRDGNQEIYIMNGDGSSSVNLTQHPTNDYAPRWSMDRSQFVFVSERDGNPEVYLMDVASKKATRLTNHEGIDADPDLSPDGKWVTFTSNRTGNDEVWIMKTDGTGLKNLSSHAAKDGVPRFSPDGKRILFTTDRDGNFELYTMSTDGDDLKNLTQHEAHDFAGNWHISGDMIVFSSERSASSAETQPKNDIYTLDLKNLMVKRLTEGDFRKYGPVFSRSGQMILFSGGFKPENEDYQLVKINKDGSGQKVLTTGEYDNSDGSW